MAEPVRIPAPATGMDIASGGGSSSTPYRDRAERAGIDVERVEHVSSTAEISLEPHTVYAVHGRLDRDGDISGRAEHVAIVGLGDGVLPVPAGNRTYDVGVRGGPFLFSGVDIDQTAPGAWGRIAAPGDGMHAEDFRTIGSGRRAHPDPSSPLGYKSGPALSLPATDESATNVIRNVENVHNGVFADEHEGDREIGIWHGAKHQGTLRVINTELSGWPNNAIYATACPGAVEVDGGTYLNDGVCAIRLAHGHVKGADVEFDASRDTLDNAHTPDHATVGVAAEQKNAGANGEPGPDVIDVTVRMVNVGKGGTGLRAYDIHTDGDWGVIEDVEIHIEHGAGDYAADIELRGDVEAIRNVVMEGSNREHHSVDNRSGERVVIDGFERDYPGSRGRDKGAPVDWR